MYRDDHNQLVYSPSDLIRFMESSFASWMERLHLERPHLVQRDEPSDEMKLITKTGNSHEAAYLATLKSEGRQVVEITDRRDEAAIATRGAIEAGVDIIYQGYLTKKPFAGFTDFLVNVGDGEPVYEVWDTKLARKTKPYYLIQLCCYAEMLEVLQGTRPKYVRVVLGDSDVKRYRTEDHDYYYLCLQDAFLNQMEEFSVDADPPPPDPRSDHGLWQSHADRWLVERDHLVQVRDS